MQRRKQRLIAVVCLTLVATTATFIATVRNERSVPASRAPAIQRGTVAASPALTALGTLAIKGRAPKTGYTRAEFSDGWQDLGACNVRDYILGRDLVNAQVTSSTNCSVTSGTLNDPYTGKQIQFVRGPTTSSKVQIDHVVALSDAWQTGAQQLSKEQRYQLANDPLELLAVDGQANIQKSDGDAATWLPPNKAYRCQYVARQIAVKQKYQLWVTSAERDAMQAILSNCPDQLLPVVAPA